MHACVGKAGTALVYTYRGGIANQTEYADDALYAGGRGRTSHEPFSVRAQNLMYIDSSIEMAVFEC